MQVLLNCAAKEALGWGERERVVIMPPPLPEFTRQFTGGWGSVKEPGYSCHSRPRATGLRQDLGGH